MSPDKYINSPDVLSFNSGYLLLFVTFISATDVFCTVYSTLHSTFSKQCTVHYSVQCILQCQTLFTGVRKGGVLQYISQASQLLGCLGTVSSTVMCTVQHTEQCPVQFIITITFALNCIVQFTVYCLLYFGLISQIPETWAHSMLQYSLQQRGVISVQCSMK